MKSVSSVCHLNSHLTTILTESGIPQQLSKCYCFRHSAYLSFLQNPQTRKAKKRSFQKQLSISVQSVKCLGAEQLTVSDNILRRLSAKSAVFQRKSFDALPKTVNFILINLSNSRKYASRICKHSDKKCRILLKIKR